jgi:putative transposase
VKYAQIETLFKEYPVRRVCQLLGVAPSGYYRYAQHQPSQHALDDEMLLKEIRRIFVESYETYGSPRIHAALKQAGYRVARKRVERLMREHKIVPHMVKRLRGTTKRNPAHASTPNLLEQNFVAAAPNQVWLTDTTQFETHEGVRYLATVEDLFSRRIVGWSTASRFDTDLVSAALSNALQSRNIRPGALLELIHHSDQGSQYTSHSYLALLERFGLTSSMSGRGNAYDNAPMESFFATLKKEWTHGRIYRTHATLDADLFEFIEIHYNRKRLHSALDFRSPVAFEDACAAQSTQPFPPKDETLSTSFREAVAFCPL